MNVQLTRQKPKVLLKKVALIINEMKIKTMGNDFKKLMPSAEEKREK